jgi:hypothetical protein
MACVEILMPLAAASGTSLLSPVKARLPFIHMAPVENIHPLQAGLFRRKHRSERRYGLPRRRARSHDQDERRQERDRAFKKVAAPTHRTRVVETESQATLPLISLTRVAMTPRQRCTHVDAGKP